MHRDFQSQNIHFKNGCVKAIDFQTATKGLLQYDLASLLKDAYFVIDEKMRDALVDFYMDVLTEKWDIKIDRQEFVKTFICNQGNIKEVEKALGISYPTVKNRLTEIVNVLCPSSNIENKEFSTSVLDEIDRGEISVEEAIKKIKKRS